MKNLTGCSGFHYKHWKGDFYPADLPERKWFEFYCRHFNTLELNVTFYRFPRLPVLEGWYGRSPAGFCFSVKAPRAITHFKKLQGTAGMLADFYEAVTLGLKEKLGCVLFQFPPNFHYTGEHLKLITGSLDSSFKNVVEFRHESWWHKDVYSELGRAGIAFCGMSHPDFPDGLISNTSHLYYRMHGSSQLYASNYSDEELNRLQDQIKSKDSVKEAYIYFNNDVSGYAVTNAKYLAAKLDEG